MKIKTMIIMTRRLKTITMIIMIIIVGRDGKKKEKLKKE